MRISMTSVKCVVGTMALALSAVASAQGIPTGVVVRGVVFDSLAMAPVANASVWLPGGNQATNTDDRGRFELDNVPRGTRFLAFSSAALDSLGLGILGTEIEATGNGKPVSLTTPSFRSVWRSLCEGVPRASGTDSGIVWGTIRDAGSDTRLHGAAAGFSWYDLKVGKDKRYAFNERTHENRTDSAGNYYACGLPSDIKISSEARGAKSASGTLEYVIGSRRLYRMDLLVSTEMVTEAPPSATSADSAESLRASGTSTLRGIVRDRKGSPVAGALVTLSSRDSATRTNTDGQFTIARLPAGSHALQARLIGFAPATALVELRPGAATSVVLDLPDAQSLATVNVRADRVAGTDRQGFEYRKKTGFGYTLTEKSFENRPDVVSVLMGLPRVVRAGSMGRWTIGIQKRGGGGICIPYFYMDARRTSADEITMYPPTHFRAVELYSSPHTIPLGFDGNECGVVLFWSKQNPRW